MPRLRPARHRARSDAPNTGRNQPTNPVRAVAPGWCATCHQNGQFVPAWSQPTGSVCAVHATSPGAPPPEHPPPGLPPPTQPRRDPHPSGRPDGRTLQRARASATRRARRLRYGRRRAAARLRRGRYDPHPALENFLPPGRLRDQDAALRAVEDLLAAQNWRADRRAAWGAILRQLVCCMDWHTGLVCAVTAGQLAAAGDRAPRTLSRVIAWAVEQGLVIVAEQGASAAFLGTDQGRTPTYAIYRPPSLPAAAVGHSGPPPALDQEQPTHILDHEAPEEELGDLPTPEVEHKPSNGGRQQPAPAPEHPWPLFGIPQTSTDRNRATHRFLQRLGLDGAGVSAVPRWRARALLIMWWRQGASPAGLLYALEHHPDQPQSRRGPAWRGARDPLRVLAHRLKPWDGRLGELPVTVRGLPGDYTQTYRRQHHHHSASPRQSPPAHAPAWAPTSHAEHRAALRAQFAQHRLISRRNVI